MRLPILLGLAAVLSAAAAIAALSRGGAAGGDVVLLNVSYDPTREFYAQYNALFARHWLEKTGQKVSVKQSHGGSGKQARSIIFGLPADVVTLALGFDIDGIQKHSGRIIADWQQKFPENSSPYTSTIVLLVREGNPKGIRGWEDVAREGVEVITANPKTSGGARWNYLAAWGFALQQNGGDQDKAREFVTRIYQHVKVLDSGARGATTTFLQRGLGDVLITWENEALLAVREAGADKVEVVTPSVSILCEPPVAVVDKVVDRRGTRQVASEYLNYLYSDEAQDLAARHFYRPRSEKIAARYDAQFKKVKLFTVDEVFGGWGKAQKEHFADRGVFDEMMRSR